MVKEHEEQSIMYKEFISKEMERLENYEKNVFVEKSELEKRKDTLKIKLQKFNDPKKLAKEREFILREKAEIDRLTEKDLWKHRIYVMPA